MYKIKISCNKSPSAAPIIIISELLKSDGSVNIEWGETTSLEIVSGESKGVNFTSVASICRFLARICPGNLYGSTKLEKTEVDHWLELCSRKYTIPEFKDCIEKLNKALSTVTFLVGDAVTLADIFVWSMLYSNKQFLTMLANNTAPVNLNRWYNYLSSKDAFISLKSLFPHEHIGSNDTTKLEKIKTEDRGKFTELPGAEMGKVVVRFPPEASGYLHIGHAKAALLNAHYQVSFQGKLIMRFDDTNPEKEKEDFEKVILEDVEMLQIKPDMYTYTSDHFDTLLEKCEHLLKSSLAFVDDTDPETMKSEREQRSDSKNRTNDATKNWSMWEEMKKGTEYGKKCCVRAKIDMTSDNGCLRDPTLYRCKSMSHPRTGNKYNVYPTYDFACPIVDSIEGVTHALRTTEYHDRDEQYFWILDVLKMRKPHIYEYSRLNMTNTVLSKRKLTWFVENGTVDGWDDPRMPTVRGVLRKGMTVEGLKQFIVAQGSSRSVVVMEWDKIWAFNKKVIDPVAPRYNAVEKNEFVTVMVEGAAYEALEVAKHPKNSELGSKNIYVGPKLLIDRSDANMMKEGESVTFINWGNLIIQTIKKNSSGEITCIEAKLNLDNKDYKKTLKVTWVIDHDEQPLIPCMCIYYDHLISKPVLGKDEDFKNYLNDNTKIVVDMLGDSLLSTLKKGDIIQIQRKGFFICDEPYDKSCLRHTSREGPLVLISIPDGSKDTTSLPLVVKQIRERKESEKERMSSLKGKISEKSSKVSDANTMKEGKNVTFINWDNMIIQNVKKNSSGEITYIEGKLNSEEQKSIYGGEGDISCGTFNCTATNNPVDLDSQICAKVNLIQNLKTKNADKSKIDTSLSELKCLLKSKRESVDFCSNDLPSPTVVELSNNTAKTPEKTNNKEMTLKHLLNNPKVLDLNSKIQSQGNIVRQLKSQKADKAMIDSAVKELLHLKAEFKNCSSIDWKPDIGNNLVNAELEKKSETKNTARSATELNELITLQGNVVRKLKSEKADKSIIENNVKKLLELKAEYKISSGKEWKPFVHSEESQEKKSETKNVVRSATELNELITLQGNVVRKLKSEKADKSIIENNVKKLLELKEEYKVCSGKEWKPLVHSEESNAQNSNPSSTNPKSKKTGDKQMNDKNNSNEAEANVKKVTRLGLEVKKEENLAEWYSQVLTKSEMIEYYDISGCYILRPWSFSIWESIQNFFDTAIKSLGVTNTYFPMFVSSTALEREKTHISDFAPEVAWVTKSGSSDLDVAIAIRPTSETVMYPSYAKWIRSHRDLPLRLNQWCNVVRWEFRNPQPFIRTREFLWQEGHTAFATKEEAENEVYTILDLYAQVYEHLLAIPVIRGKKTEKEKFAGADFTTTTEAYVAANGRGIQGATSHHLGQNFSKMFEIVYEDPETSEKQFVYQNSWGLSTRSIGAVVMIHGDNTGLVLPPRVAAYQVVIVPCGVTASLKESDKDHLYDKCSEFKTILENAKISVKIDFRDNYSPGWKFNYWELKGVPIRIELGPKDIKKNQFVAVRRDTSEKITMGMDSAPNSVLELLDNIHDSMFEKAKKVRDEHLCVTQDWSEFCNKLDQRFIIQSPFCGNIACEDNIKKDSARNADENLEAGAPSMGAKSLCIPFQQPAELKSDMKCIHPKCFEKPKYFTLFGRSY